LKNFTNYLFITILFINIIGCEILDPNPGPKPVTTIKNSGVILDTTTPSITRGSQLFGKLCSSCHGDSAEGSIVYSGSLVGKKNIDSIVKHGRKAMPAFSDLSDSSIKSIELFLKSLVVILTNETGQELYIKFCSSCHGDSVTGTPTFSGSIKGYTPIKDIVKNGKGKMSSIDLDDAPIAKIQDYLLSLKTDTKKLSGNDYYKAVCSGCHSSEGDGVANKGYQIKNPDIGFSNWVIRNGRTQYGSGFNDPMPSYGKDTLSDIQLNEIITLLRTIPKPTTGNGLYVRFCQNCHGTNARGGSVGVNIKNEGNFSNVIRSGKGGVVYSNRNKFMPKWNSTELNDSEIKLIQVYVSKL
jgi:mono/diheme cytochrome c family protein